MTDIAPIGRTPASSFTGDSRAIRSAAGDSARARGSDSVELSQHARYLSQLANLPDIRQGLVDRVRSEIAQGRYETPDKIDALLDELASDLR